MSKLIVKRQKDRQNFTVTVDGVRLPYITNVVITSAINEIPKLVITLAILKPHPNSKDSIEINLDPV